MSIRRSFTACVFDWNRQWGCASQSAIFFHRTLSMKCRIVRTGALKEVFRFPYGPYAQHVAHLMCDDVSDRTVRFHSSQISGVEVYDSLNRQERGDASVWWPYVCWSSLAQNASWTIYVATLSFDDDVINYFTVNLDAWEVANDQPGPPISSGRECVFLVLSQPTKEANFDCEWRHGGGDSGGLGTNFDSPPGPVDFYLIHVLFSFSKYSNVVAARVAGSG